MIKLELERNEALRKPANEGQGENIMTRKEQKGFYRIINLPKGVKINESGTCTLAQWRAMLGELLYHYPAVRGIWTPAEAYFTCSRAA